MARVSIERLYAYLSSELGPSGWWPAESKLEILLGAILVQNTNWRNAERAFQSLKEATGLDPTLILAMDPLTLQQVIYSAGFYKNKASAIQGAVRFFDDHVWDYEQMLDTYGPNLRKILLSLRGIGQETADVLLVYVFDQVAFISDAYARKLFSYLEEVDYCTYSQLAQAIVMPANFDYRQAQDLHGLIDIFGKDMLKDPFASQALKTAVMGEGDL